MDKLTQEKQEKLKMWQGKLKKLEDEYKVIMIKRGEAIAMGDLSENAAFQMLDEDAVTYRVRIDEVKSIIYKIEKPSFAKQSLRPNSLKASVGKGEK